MQKVPSFLFPTDPASFNRSNHGHLFLTYLPEMLQEYASIYVHIHKTQPVSTSNFSLNLSWKLLLNVRLYFIRQLHCTRSFLHLSLIIDLKFLLGLTIANLYIFLENYPFHLYYSHVYLQRVEERNNLWSFRFCLSVVICLCSYLILWAE